MIYSKFMRIHSPYVIMVNVFHRIILTHIFLALKVLKGSHHLGRIDHVRVGDQVGADLERVEQVKKVSIHGG